jgi:NADPH:quinone reductase-like Zn-dependent oxidoreductase
MRALVMTGHKGAGSLQLQERPDPVVGPAEVRIEVAAAGVNFADVMATQGLYPDAPKPPAVIGYEVAGTVLEVGDGVGRLKPGERVMAGTQFGGYATQVVVPEGDAVPIKEQLSFEQAAAIPVNYGTAWAALMTYGNLQIGERVLIHSAGGGVGIAATQIASYQRAEVYGTASPSKHERLRELGVAHPLDYTKDGWERGLPKFDVILDAIGGASFRRSYGLLRAGGRLVAFGAASAVSGERKNPLSAVGMLVRTPRFSMIKQMGESKAVIGLNLLTLWKDRGTLDPWIEPLTKLLDDGAINPVVAGVFPFAQASEAYRMIIERRNVGKVVLIP